MKKPSIGKMLSYIHRINQKELASILKPFDIGGGGHHNYLKAILSNPGLNQDQLTNELKFDKATTTRCVKHLEEAGYVYRSVDSRDRRSYLLYPTPKAKDFEPVLKRILDEFSLQMTNCLSESDKQQFADLLKKIYDSKQGQMIKVIATDTDIAGKEWLITTIGYQNLPGNRDQVLGYVTRSRDLPDRTACRHVSGLLERVSIKTGVRSVIPDWVCRYTPLLLIPFT